MPPRTAALTNPEALEHQPGSMRLLWPEVRTDQRDPAWTKVLALATKRQAQEHSDGGAVDMTVSWLWEGRRDGPKTHSGLALGDGDNPGNWKTRTMAKSMYLKSQALFC